MRGLWTCAAAGLLTVHAAAAQQELQTNLNLRDENNDGRISVEEFVARLPPEVRAAGAEQAAIEQFLRLDEDDDRHVSFLELTAALPAQAAAEPRVRTRLRFEEVDADGDGRITETELEPQREQTPPALAAIWDRAVSAADADRDGVLTPGEWETLRAPG